MKILPLFLFMIPAFLFAQEDIFDGDALFDDSSLFDTSEEGAIVEQEDSVSVLESMEEDNLGIQWGGKIYSDLEASWSWQDPLEGAWADESSWSPEFGADLFIDARPDRDFRVYGKGHFEYDAATEEMTGRVKEIFTDFNWQESLYFRMGKQTINWGVGYLYSPAEVLNLNAIDPLDPEAELDGPLALKTQVPLDAGNLQIYTLFQQMENPEEITFAPKAEFLLGNWEVGAGGIFDIRNTPKGALFLTGPLGPLDFLGEALVQNGSDQQFLPESGNPLALERRKDRLFLSATAGLLYYDNDNRVNLLGQYWYDGEAQSPEDPETIGHHRGGVNLSKGFQLNPEAERSAILTLNLLWLGDFSDSSGLIQGGAEWEPMDHAALGVDGTWYYGSDNSSYRFRGPGLTSPEFEVSAHLKLGYGAF